VVQLPPHLLLNLPQKPLLKLLLVPLLLLVVLLLLVPHLLLNPPPLLLPGLPLPDVVLPLLLKELPKPVVCKYPFE
jgi:hypothetical protein